MSAGSAIRPDGFSTSKPRLSCELCRGRKVKCDKLFPCSNCQLVGVTCIAVERQRLSRGRTRTPKGKTMEISSNCRVSSDSPNPVVEEPLVDVQPPLPDSMLKYNGKLAGTLTSSNIEGPPWRASFWADLTDGSHGLGEVIKRPLQSKEHGVFNQRDESESLLLGFKLSSPVSYQVPYSTPKIREHLCTVYSRQVDPVFKVLHWPSVCSYLIYGKQYLNYQPGDSAAEALAAAVYYTATCSLTDMQCLSLFAENKAAVIPRYRAACEASLDRAGLTTTQDLTVLQAFVLYLISTRSHDRSRRVWTLLSLALRIAQAISIHIPSPPFTLRPFENEIRRRVWHAIGFLDMQAALDRATDPMIPFIWLQSHLPSNINDSDFDFDSESSSLQDSENFTDMTFTLLTCAAQNAVRLLSFYVNDWEVQQGYIKTFQERAAVLLKNYHPDPDPFHWYTKHVIERFTGGMQLFALRPLLRRSINNNAPSLRPGSLLELSTLVLRTSQELKQDPRAQLWSWYDGIFPGWHALAVALAELCAQEEPSSSSFSSSSTVVARSCWPLIELSFGHFRNLVAAESSQGVIWFPIEKLMKRAREKMMRISHLQIRSGGMPGCRSSSSAAALNTGAIAPARSDKPPITAISSSVSQQRPPNMSSRRTADMNMGLDQPQSQQQQPDEFASTLNSFDDLPNDMIAWTDWENFFDGLEAPDNPMMGFFHFT